jgi:hypothetical protein
MGQAYGLEKARDPQGCELSGEYGLRPARGHEALRGQVVDFVWLEIANDGGQGVLIK